jgi:hypothetical protein
MQKTRCRRMQGVGEEIWGEAMEGLVNWVIKEFSPDLSGCLIVFNNRQFQLLEKHFRIREPLVLSI